MFKSEKNLGLRFICILFIISLISWSISWGIKKIIQNSNKGYYLITTGMTGVDDVVRIAVSKHDPQECSKIRISRFDFMGPDAESLKLTCLFETARVLKDPTICDGIQDADNRNSCRSDIPK